MTELVIFDCDGVLIDNSDRISLKIQAEMSPSGPIGQHWIGLDLPIPRVLNRSVLIVMGEADERRPPAAKRLHGRLRHRDLVVGGKSISR